MKYLLAIFGILLLEIRQVTAQSDLPKKPKTVFSGYIQNQFQTTKETGISSWAGGDFEKNSNNRFLIRRGRLKVQRNEGVADMTLQLDATPDGVRFVDAFLKLKRTPKDAVGVSLGLFDRPFGYAISYSSSNRDFPERPMVFQSLFPKEKDLGAMLSWHPKEKLAFIKFDLALLNGTGVTAKDYDSKKDLSANLHFDFDNITNKLDLGWGISYYKGGVKSGTSTYYQSRPEKEAGFQKFSIPVSNNLYLNRDYFGLNLQLSAKNNFGLSTFKTEYITGKQPGVGQPGGLSVTAANRSFSSLPKTDLYHRNFSSYYFWITQQFGNSKLHGLLAYDYYDPNSNISGLQVGLAGNNSTAGDLKFTTWGYGLAYHYDNNIKFTLYYDKVKNETSSLPEFSTDQKDNVLTLRIQYKW